MGIDHVQKQVEVDESLEVLNLRHGDAREFLRESNSQFDFISAVEVLELSPKIKFFTSLKQVNLQDIRVTPGDRCCTA